MYIKNWLFLLKSWNILWKIKKSMLLSCVLQTGKWDIQSQWQKRQHPSYLCTWILSPSSVSLGSSLEVEHPFFLLISKINGIYQILSQKVGDPSSINFSSFIWFRLGIRNKEIDGTTAHLFFLSNCLKESTTISNITQGNGEWAPYSLLPTTHRSEGFPRGWSLRSLMQQRKWT